MSAIGGVLAGLGTHLFRRRAKGQADVVEAIKELGEALTADACETRKLLREQGHELGGHLTQIAERTAVLLDRAPKP